MMPTALGRGDSDGERTTRSRLRRAAAVVGLVLLLAMVVPFVVFAVPQTVGADHGFVILSGSMEPAISPGDAVVVDASASIGVGDVITFEDGNSVPTTHRVVGVEDGQYVTQGDANENVDDRLVPPEAVLGAVTLTIPLIGHLVLWANTPVGYVALVLVPIVLLVGNELFVWTRADGADDTGDDPDDAEDGTENDPSPFGSIRDVDQPEPNDRPLTADGSVGPSGSDGVGAVDLQLTALTLSVLAGYAVWNVYTDVSASIAPGSLSVAVMTGAVLGLATVGWILAGGWVARRRADRTTAAARTSSTDGGTDREFETGAVRSDDDAPRTEGER